MFTWLKNLFGIKTPADTIKEVEAKAAAVAQEIKIAETKVEAVVATVVEEVKAVETVVEAKIEAAVEKVKKARKPRKKKGE
jgi:hypothetical protein